MLFTEQRNAYHHQYTLSTHPPPPCRHDNSQIYHKVLRRSPSCHPCTCLPCCSAAPLSASLHVHTPQYHQLLPYVQCKPRCVKMQHCVAFCLYWASHLPHNSHIAAGITHFLTLVVQSKNHATRPALRSSVGEKQKQGRRSGTAGWGLFLLAILVPAPDRCRVSAHLLVSEGTYVVFGPPNVQSAHWTLGQRLFHAFEPLQLVGVWLGPGRTKEDGLGGLYNRLLGQTAGQ